MPAEVDYMFSARSIVPWHGHGHVIEHVRDAEEAQRLSGIEDATLEPVYVARKSSPQELILVPDKRAVMVPSLEQPLQIVSNHYRLLQPVEAFSFADTVIDTGDAEYETAGSLKGQRLYWIMLRINDEIRVGKTDDVIKPYLFIRDSRDGSSAMKWSYVNERVVCANTWRKASAEGNITSIRHRNGMSDRLKEAKEVLLQARAAMVSEKALVEALAYAQVNRKAVEKFYTDLLPLPPLPNFSAMPEIQRGSAQQTYEISKMHVVRDRSTLVQIFEEGKGAELAGKTTWGLFNSVTDFVDHYRQPDAKAETIMYSSMLGVGADLKARALDLAYSLASGRN